MQPLGGERPVYFDGLFKIPTFEEVIALVKRKLRRKAASSESILRPNIQPITNNSACR